ncbi:MAG: triacylglycerol lipase [Oceanicoccus sp.]|jgi:triacylglycerol lipase
MVINKGNVMKKISRWITGALILSSISIAPVQAGLLDWLFPKSTYAQTQYPIVMVPGAFAFDDAFGILDYWHGITDELRDEGAEVYVVNLSSLAFHEKRGEELLADIQEIIAITGAEKVNLMAHSQGASASRYVAAKIPHLIASISCSHCMNEGTHFAGNASEFLENNTLINFFTTAAVDTFFNFLEAGSAYPSDGEFNSDYRGTQSSQSLLIAASLDDYDRFNALYPQAMPTTDCSQINSGIGGHTGGGEELVDGVRYFSWGGNKTITNIFDPLDLTLIPVVGFFMPDNLVWDGLVPGCGQALGTLLRDDYPTNHYDAINQTAGITRLFVDVPSIFVTQANRLKNIGL